MGIFEYIRGRRFRLRSSLPVDEVARRINAESGSLLFPFSSGIKGGVWWRRLRLVDNYLGMFTYNAKPVLAGTLRDDMGGCIVDAKYRAPLWAYLFFVLWYGMLTLFTLISIVGLVEDRFEPGGWIIFVMLPIFAAMPLAMHYMFSGGQKSLDSILHFVEREAGLAVID